MTPEQMMVTEPPSARIRWFFDANAYGGVVCERLLAALPLADGLWCGLVFICDSPGAPRIQFWERIDDLERQGFVPIRPARARAICDALPRFLDRLDQLGDRGQATGDRHAGVSLC